MKDRHTQQTPRMPRATTTAIILACLLLGALDGLDWLEGVRADDTCTPTPADVCLGIAQLSTQTGGLLGARRCWQLTTDTADADACDHVNDEPTWDMNAGACLTLRYRDDTVGATPPSNAQTVTLQLRFDSTATVIRTLHNAAPPADNTDFTVCATDTGAAGGVARSGTLRIYIRVFNDGAGAANDYDIDSDGTNTVGASDQFTKGSLRGNVIVASIATNTPATGTYCTCFALGITGDETATVTTTLTQPFGDANLETVQLVIFSGAATIETFAAADLDTGSTANAAVIDQTYRFTGIASAQTWLGARISLPGTAALTGFAWTAFASAGHGSGITITGANAEKSQTFQASSHARFDSDGTYNASPLVSGNWASDTINPDADPAVYHRAETFTITYYILNARGDKVTRSFTGAGFFTGTETTATVNCMTGSTGTAAAGGLYTTMQTWPSDGSCTAASTEEGTPYKYRINSQAADPSIATTQWITQGTTSNVALTGIDPGGPSIGRGFIGAMYLSSDSDITGGTPEYAPLFGDSGTRTTEAAANAIAPFRYNLTNLFTYSDASNCGNLQAGESLVITLRVNGVDSGLTGLCSFGVPANSYSLDRDTVEVMPGDRLTIRFAVSGTTALRSIRVSLSMQAFTMDQETVIPPDLLSMSALPGFSEEATTGLILLTLLMIYCINKDRYWQAFGAFVSILSLLWIGGDWFLWGVLFMFIGFGMELIFGVKDGDARKQAQEDVKQ